MIQVKRRLGDCKEEGHMEVRGFSVGRRLQGAVEASKVMSCPEQSVSPEAGQMIQGRLGGCREKVMLMSCERQVMRCMSNEVRCK